MADDKPQSNYYSLLGGINTKASAYATGQAQFLDLRNVDFDVPNALQKRPGSTFAMSAGLGVSAAAQASYAVTSLFEFIKLDGSSYMIAGTNPTVNYLGQTGLNLISNGWSSTQPIDMLTFVNRLWMANGNQWQTWDGLTNYPAGVPVMPVGNGLSSTPSTGGATLTTFPAAGVTATPSRLVGVWLAFSQVRSDGYYGPLGVSNTIQLIKESVSAGNGEWFSPSNMASATYLTVSGLTNSPGITQIAAWVAIDWADAPYSSTTSAGSISHYNVTGVNGIAKSATTIRFFGPPSFAFAHLDDQINTGADLSKFKLFGLYPAGTTQIQVNLSAGWTAFLGNAPVSFSGMPFDFFATYTPKYMEISNNVMMASGFSNAPSTFFFSDVGQPEVFQPQNSIEARTNDGDHITGAKDFNSQYYIFKETSFFTLTGTDPDTYQLVQRSGEMGCISNQTIIEYDNNLAWLDRKGIVNYNGANYSIISTQVEPIFRRMNLVAARENAVAAHHLLRNQIWFGIPVDGSVVNNVTVVYDYLIQAWAIFDGYNAASYVYAKSGLNLPTVWRGSYSGHIHYTGSSFMSDSGRAITCLLSSRFENYQGQNETSIWRRLFLDVASINGATTPINGLVYSNYDQSTVQATFAMYQNQFQSRAEMGVVGKSSAFTISHNSATLPLLINGFGWAKRPLRNV